MICQSHHCHYQNQLKLKWQNLINYFQSSEMRSLRGSMEDLTILVYLSRSYENATVNP